VTVATTLRPQAARDTDVPDRGYHYWPLDHIANNVVVSAPLALAEGVALGIKGTYGLDVRANVSSDATARGLNRIVSCQNVQEQGGVTGGNTFMQLSGAYNPAIRFRFTELSVGQGRFGTILDAWGTYPFQALTFRDCWLRGAYWSLWPATSSDVWIALTNNIVEQSSLAFSHYYYTANTPLRVGVYNNLFRSGGVTFQYEAGTQNPTWNIKDNLFDGASQSLSGAYWSYYTARSHNGFTAGTANSLSGTSDRDNLTADFVPGPLGDYYYPNPGGSLSGLRDVGSRSAAAGELAHFTTKASQAREGSLPTDTVDIGFHYPADSDSDGLDDVSELQYGFNPDTTTGVEGPHGDIDGDGVSNLREYQLGNNPVEHDGFANPLGLPPVGARYLRILSKGFRVNNVLSTPPVLELVHVWPGLYSLELHTNDARSGRIHDQSEWRRGAAECAGSRVQTAAAVCAGGVS
jgi:hypothetical protein